ncbi:MAG: hypothetical protein EA424_28660, partial [Planctomycetaceae bacterium]
MSKPHWSLTTILLITPLAASCSRQSSEPQAIRDDSPAVVTQTVVLDDLIAKSRQIEHSHRARQQLHDEQQQSQVVAVAYPSPEREPSDWRSLVDDQTMDELQQQIRQARRRVTSGFRLAATRASSAMNRLRTVAIYAHENASPAEEPAEEQPAEEQPAEEQPAEDEPADEEPADEEPADAAQPEDPEQDSAQDEPLSEDQPPVEPEIEVSPSDAVAAVQKVPPARTVRSVRACRTPRRLLRASTPRLGRRIARLRQNVPPCPAPTIV